jgi:serine/threonine protein kinase
MVHSIVREPLHARVSARPHERPVEAHAPAELDELLSPEGYAISRLIASSARGAIYRASDHAGHQVAVRVLGPEHATDAETLDACVREARASLRLHHPHIVRSVAAGVRGEQRWLIMEFIDGGSLRSRVLEGGPLSEREAVVLLAQMAQALGYAWRHGVAHHAVEPASILVAPARLGVLEPFCAKLSNFGISKLRQEPVRRGARDDSRGDIRGLAATVCWALTPHERDEESPTTLAVTGVSADTMQLIGAMLDGEQAGIRTWEEVLGRVRRLPGSLRAGIS